MCFATKRAECLRERMMPRRRTVLPHMPAPEQPVDSMAQQQDRLTKQPKDRSSQRNLKQPKTPEPHVLQWWEKEVVKYAFSHPHVRNRLERLMGSNVSRLTDRIFMQRLAERIQDEHVQQMQMRIRAREEAEVEREKKLILEGKIPVDQVPHELSEHPVFKVSRLTSQAIDFRRSKVQEISKRASFVPPGTLLALAKAMGPEGTDEEDESDIKDFIETTLDETGFEEEESKSDQEGEFSPEDEGKHEDEDSAKVKFVEDDVGHYEREDMRKHLFQTMEPDDSKAVVGDEGTEEMGEEESEEHSEDEKRQAVLRESQRSRQLRQSRLTQSGSTPAKDDRRLSDDELQREKANMQRVSVRTAARNEWQQEVETSEALARERDKNYVVSDRDLRRMRYEAPLIEELRRQETVADLYRIADEIVGGLWTKIPPKTKED